MYEMSDAVVAHLYAYQFAQWFDTVEPIEASYLSWSLHKYTRTEDQITFETE